MHKPRGEECPGTGTKVAERGRHGRQLRAAICGACNQTVPVNADGTLRQHVAPPEVR